MTFIEWREKVKGINDSQYKKMSANKKHALLREYILSEVVN